MENTAGSEELKEILDKNPAVTPQCTISSAEGLQQQQQQKSMSCSKGKKLVLRTKTPTKEGTS